MSPAVFKTDTTAAKVVGWVRFPDAPAKSEPAGLSGRRGSRVGMALGALALLMAAESARAQEPEGPPLEPDAAQAAQRDTAQAVERDTAQAVERAEGDTAQAGERRQPVSPTGALLRSIIVPGWGQTAARQPARGAVYFTVWSGGVFMILKSNAEANAAERGEDEELIESRKQAREDWMLFTGIWALLSGVDAWVSAQFSGFEGEVRPPQDGSPGVEFRYPVKLF